MVNVNRSMAITRTITVIGSLNYDVVTTSDRLPGPGETIAAKGFETHNGGKGANQALACARLRDTAAGLARRAGEGKVEEVSKVRVRMVGCVGSDPFGDRLKADLNDAGVDTALVKTAPQGTPTGVATILVDERTGQNRILVYPGANGCVSTQDVVAVCKGTGPAGTAESDDRFGTGTGNGVGEGDALVLQNEIPVEQVTAAIRTVVASMQSKHSKPPLIVYNPSPLEPNFPQDLYRHISCLVLNSTEARAIVADEAVRALLTNDDDASQALNAIVPISESLKLPRYVVITLGPAGCVYYDAAAPDQKPVHVPAKKPPAPIIDTTGAGDTFLGGLAAHLTHGRSLRAAVDIALAASSIAITRKGAGDGIPFFAELDL